MNPRWPRGAALRLAAAAAVVAAVPVSPAGAVTGFKRGDPAPRISLAAADGTTVDTAQLRGSVLLVLFGDAAQDRTQRACRLIKEALGSPRLAGERITWIVVLSRNSRPGDLDPEFRGSPHPPLVVHDTERRAFGAWQVLVVPSFVVVDREGLVAHAMAGLTNRFGDIVSDALAFACGKLSAEGLDQALGSPPEERPDADRLRARRMAIFARRLAANGLEALAEQKYQEALQIAPDLAAARLGLGDLLLGQERLDEAEACYRQMLAAQPGANEASLGLAHVRLLRGGSSVEAQALVEEVLRSEPRSARARYLMGLIHEGRGEAAAAAEDFKLAAQLLLARVTPGDETEQEDER